MVAVFKDTSLFVFFQLLLLRLDPPPGPSSLPFFFFIFFFYFFFFHFSTHCTSSKSSSIILLLFYFYSFIFYLFLLPCYLVTQARFQTQTATLPRKVLLVYTWNSQRTSPITPNPLDIETFYKASRNLGRQSVRSIYFFTALCPFCHLSRNLGLLSIQN